MLTAEDELVWARELFRADYAARAIRTCQDAERELERDSTVEGTCTTSVTTHVGPIPKVRNTPIGPAGPIPPLDTKLLVTVKVLLSESVPAADAYTSVVAVSWISSTSPPSCKGVI